jgi:glycosyltransferase involved in cell wall biosynthesis
MKIKILVDAHVFDNSFQGSSTYIKGLYLSLVDHPDFEITLAAVDIEKLKKEFKDERFKFVTLPSGSKIKRLLFDFPKIIKTHRYDFAHFQYIVPFRKHCKFINTIHDVLFIDYPEYFPLGYRLSRKPLFYFSSKLSDIVCTVSEFSKRALIRNYQIDEKKITVTPNAVNVVVDQSVDVKSKFLLNQYILFVSRMEPRKNHFLMLKSFVDLKLYEQGYKMVFVGRTKDIYTPLYENYLKSIPEIAEKYIVNLENVSEAELRSLYEQADLFVYPSLAEGFGIPPLEAAVANCKVLCSNQTAMQDFNFFGNYLFDPNNTEEFKSKVIQVLSDKDYPFQKIREAVLKKYNWHTSAEIFADALKKLSNH